MYSYFQITNVGKLRTHLMWTGIVDLFVTLEVVRDTSNGWPSVLVAYIAIGFPIGFICVGYWLPQLLAKHPKVAKGFMLLNLGLFIILLLSFLLIQANPAGAAGALVIVMYFGHLYKKMHDFSPSPAPTTTHPH